MSFQAVFTTDGVSSFVLFLYNDPDSVDVILERVVGFDAGDQMNGVAAVNIDIPSFGILENRNIFRIDGMREFCRHLLMK